MSAGKYINWRNILFFILLPIISIVGTVLLCVFTTVTWPTWVLALGMFVAGGLSITAGYHRLFSHRTYKATWPVRLLFVLFGSATFQGSVLEWVTDHRNHHLYTDTERDPYSIKKGFWHAHMGWLFELDRSKRDFSNVDDLRQSGLLRFQHRYFLIFATLMGFLFPMAIASLWGQAWAGLVIGGALRLTIGHQSTFCINSLCHVLGKSTYSKRISARDNWLTALITFGEGYHNFHHQFPLDYRNGVRFYQFDPGKWLVGALSFVGLASSLRRIPQYRIIQARVESCKHLIAARPQSRRLEFLHESIMQAISKVKRFEKAYAESKRAEYRIMLRHARGELSNLFQTWERMLRMKPVLE